MSRALPPEVHSHGFTQVPRVLEAADCHALLAELGPVSGAGRRGLLGLPAVARLARSSLLLDLVRPYLPAEPLPVRALYFDKSADANWLVPWHQDLTLAVRHQAEVPGFGPWSVKDGIPHVQAPVPCLEQMLTLRLHLDAADETNGALRVLPRSHALGRLSAEDIRHLRSQQPDYLCTAAAGDALLMRPLLLHASSRSTSDRHRRILHLEFAAFTLPPELAWQDAG